jgi:hypothetical protein
MSQKLKSLDITAVTPEERSAYARARPSPPSTAPATPPAFSAAPFLRFLTELLPLIQPTFDPTSTTLSTLQRKVLTNPDYLLPFREHAPSRLRILLGPDGPFSGAHAGNRRGVLFSALVFRGITFDTPALKSTAHTGFFADLAEWDDFYRSHASAPGLNDADRERWFCHPGPFGRTHGRSTANAAQFWAASRILLAFLATPDRKRYPHGPRFIDVVKHIATATHRKKTVYPTFGRLVAYLVAVDLTYAG